MDKNFISEQNQTVNKSFETIENENIHASVGFEIKESTILAGTIVEIDFTIQNLGENNLFFMEGGSSAKKRPSQFSFEGNLLKRNYHLIDPMRNVLEIGGAAGAIKILPEDTFVQRISLNQFFTFEDIYNILDSGEKDMLQIKCGFQLIIGRKTYDVLTKNNVIERDIEQILTIPVVRDEIQISNYIQGLTSTIKNQWNPNSTPEEELALQKLTTLKITPAIPFLQKLIGHPNSDVNRQIESALSELKK